MKLMLLNFVLMATRIRMRINSWNNDFHCYMKENSTSECKGCNTGNTGNKYIYQNLVYTSNNGQIQIQINKCIAKTECKEDIQGVFIIEGLNQKYKILGGNMGERIHICSNGGNYIYIYIYIVCESHALALNEDDDEVLGCVPINLQNSSRPCFSGRKEEIFIEKYAKTFQCIMSEKQYTDSIYKSNKNRKCTRINKFTGECEEKRKDSRNYLKLVMQILKFILIYVSVAGLTAVVFYILYWKCCFKNELSSNSKNYTKVRRAPNTEEISDNFQFESCVEKINSLDLNLKEREKICNCCMMSIYKEQNIYKIRECKHIFHAQCLIAWMKDNENCPICLHLLP